MNLRVIGDPGSRGKISDGDAFVFSIREGEVHPGFVVTASARLGPISCIMCYLFDRKLREGDPIPSDLTSADLLIPPVHLNKKPWSLGYFKRAKGVRGTRLLPVHCFLSPVTGKILNEFGVPVPEECCTGIVGTFALKSVLTLDDAVSDALGVPRSD